MGTYLNACFSVDEKKAIFFVRHFIIENLVYKKIMILKICLKFILLQKNVLESKYQINVNVIFF